MYSLDNTHKMTGNGYRGLIEDNKVKTFLYQ